MNFKAKKMFLLSSAFMAGFSIMVMELTASRILAPIVGSTLYTWTSVIGIIMLGLAIGNFIGGYYIDKNPSTKTVFMFFTFSAISVLFIPLIASFSRKIIILDIPLFCLIVLITFLIFFIPSLLVGCIYPCIFKFYLRELTTTGKSSGKLSASWTLGSILGTFLTGFIFISFLGSIKTLALVAFILFINGLFFYSFPKKIFLFLLIIFSALAFFSNNKSILSYKDRSIYSQESAYYLIKIFETGNKSPYGNARFMFLDFDSHGFESYNINKLNVYTNIYPVFSVLKDSINDILVLGGGPATISKNFSSYYPASSVTNVEIDPQVIKVAKLFFNTDSYDIKNEISDGRTFLEKNSTHYDLIFNDTYNSFVSVPWHLSTKEFNDLVLSHLNERGVYAINFISAREGESSLFFQSMQKTFKLTFPNYYVFSFDSDPEKVQNIVLIGVNSKERIAKSLLRKKVLPLPNGLFLSRDIRIQPNKSNSEIAIPILKDDHAPLEKLMTSVVNNYFKSFSSFYYSLL